jgi:SAM-dependent methyltransferase
LHSYIHGYNSPERHQLQAQAATLAELLHSDTHYPAGSTVLEIGCGVGAQTVVLATQSPAALFTSIDVDGPSLRVAEETCGAVGITNVRFQIADLFDLPFERASFDHVFICFVLEHLPDPATALQAIAQLVRPGGSVTVIEGDHGSAYFSPDSVHARHAIQCQVQLQSLAGGNANIGRELFPVLQRAGLSMVSVSPRMVYVDSSKPLWVDGFTRKTFTAMIEGVRQRAIDSGLTTVEQFDRGLHDLRRTAGEDGTFCYTFFKATAVK